VWINICFLNSLGTDWEKLFWLHLLRLYSYKQLKAQVTLEPLLFSPADNIVIRAKMKKLNVYLLKIMLLEIIFTPQVWTKIEDVRFTRRRKSLVE